MKYYAVIDTNVLVSAMLKWDSIPGNILELSFNKTIIPILNDDIVKEYREVLLRPKFHFTKDIVTNVIDALCENGFFVNAEHIDTELPDPKDKVFYEVVTEANKSSDAYLITGNIKHFPIEHCIVTPRQMLNIIMTET